MRILYTSDIHANPGHLQSMAQAVNAHHADTLIVGGDVVPHYLPGASDLGILDAQGRYVRNELVPALEDLKRRTGVRIFLDFGNDDFAANRSILENRADDLVNLLHMQRHALTDDVDIVGYMGVPPTPFTRKDWEKPDSRECPLGPGGRARLDGYTSRKGSLAPIHLDIGSHDTIAADLERISSRIRGRFIFVAHCPPYDTPLDLLYDGTHVGSPSIRQFIQRWSAHGKLLAALHGHIHEAPMISGSQRTLIGQTLCINPGQGDVFQYVVLELEKDRGGWRIAMVSPEPG